jgi:hypothetical protein
MLDRNPTEGQQNTSIVPSLRPVGQQFTSWVENTNHERMYLQSIKSVKHNAAKSINRSVLKKSRHLGFGVSIVHSSMPNPLTLYLASLKMRRLPPSLLPTCAKIAACLPPLIHALTFLLRRECFTQIQL